MLLGSILTFVQLHEYLCHHKVRNRLHTANLRAYRPAVRPILTLKHRTARLQWARDHVIWQLRHWTPVLFSDESCFCVDFHD